MGEPRTGSLDAAVLKVLEMRGRSVTYYIRNVLAMWNALDHKKGAPKRWGDLKTSDVLASCRRLEAKGHAAQVPSRYAQMTEWALTDAGRAALEQGGE